MSNGVVKTTDGTSYEINFPEYFSASSPFFHIIDTTKYKVQEESFQEGGKTIPLTFYGESQHHVEQGLLLAKKVLLELEQDYGVYPHEALTAHVVAAKKGRKGGMEYSGAFRSTVSSVGHEIIHQWFGRSAMPASGSAGWIDEGIATWHGQEYPRAKGISLTTRGPARLASADDYSRTTPGASYLQGARIMAELDFVFRDEGGLRPVLHAFHEAYAHRTYTSADFQRFVQERTPLQLAGFFDRRVHWSAAEHRSHRS